MTTATHDQLAHYATLPVPRYTSYPTAPHFHEGIQGADYGTWLSALDGREPISLYLHVPFCRQLCWYCGCNMKLARRQEPIAAYAETLRAEVDLVAARLSTRMTLSHLAWGGGTPTALTPDDLARTMDGVRERFDIADGAELAIECDPRTLTAEMAARIGALGFTRASFGVQEFDPTVQAAINRIQPPDMVAQAGDWLRQAGVQSLSFDLIYGLPHQTAAMLERTIATCVEMAPDRFAIFGYAHVPWMAKKQRMIDEASLPGAAERLAQANAAAEAIGALGYVPVGFDHFAKPGDPLARAAETGTLRRNFQGYTTDSADTLLGVGSSAIGRTPSGFVQNHTETGAWSRSVRNHTIPTAKGYKFAGEDTLRAAVIEQLMCGGPVNLDATAAAFGAPPSWYADAEPDLATFANDGLIRRFGPNVALTGTGRQFVRVVASAFDGHLPRRMARHSVAV